MTGPEDLVRDVARRYDDEEGVLTRDALLRLEKYRAGAGKTCARCSERKPLSAFGKDSRETDGLYRRCRSCRSGEYRALRESSPVS